MMENMKAAESRQAATSIVQRAQSGTRIQNQATTPTR